MNKTIYFFIFLFTVSCLNINESKSDVGISNTTNYIVNNGLKIDKELLSKVIKEIKKEPNPLNREVWSFDKEGNETNYILDEGLIFKFVDEQTAHSIFNKYHEKVISGNNYMFLTNMDFDDSYNTYYDIIIIEGSDPFKIIEQIGTNGLNYDVYNYDVIKKLKEWNTQIDFRFVVIDVARIHAYMNKLPDDLQNFASDVYDFCPDVIDQGYGSMDQMKSDYKENRYFWLWWD